MSGSSAHAHYENQSDKQLAHLLDAVKTQAEQIQPCIESLKNALSDCTDEQILEDFAYIQKAYENFLLLHASLYHETTDPARASEQWSHHRHDLRASLGGVKGYAELTFETLEDQGDAERAPLFAYLIELADKVLPLIDKIKVEITGPDILQEEQTRNYYATHPSRIMIIDDSLHKRELLARRLRQVGHTIIMAESGAEGLELLKKEPIDLILLDILMPGMTGHEVLRILKSKPETRDIPVLVISSISEIESIVDCIAAGADDYLPTPVNPILLHARINACLDKKVLLDRERATHQLLNETQNRLETAIESIEEGFAVFDVDDHLIMWNQRFSDIYAVGEKSQSDRLHYRTFLEENLKRGLYQEERRTPAEESFSFVADPQAWVEMRLDHHKNPTEPFYEFLSSGHWIQIIKNKTPDGGIVAVYKDVTEQVTKERRMQYLATHDPLTGLANRALFEKTLADKTTSATDAFALLYLDLDGFKAVNDTLGHDFGDFLLIEVGKRLHDCVRSNDLVARLGGDEFSVILHNTDEATATTLATRILKGVGTSVTRDGHTAPFGVSIGVALYPQDAQTADELVVRADDAMYAAKKAGKGTFRLASKVPRRIQTAAG